MDEEKILNFKVNGSYPWGRPKKRWFDNIRCDLEKLRLSTFLELDRVKWRNAIKPSDMLQSRIHAVGRKNYVELDSK